MKRKSVDLGLTATLIVLAIVLLGFVGWCMNAYKATQCDFEAPYKCEAIRAVGVFVPPVGSIAGYFTIESK